VLPLLAAALLAADPGAPLTLDGALAEASRSNPDLAAARADADAAGADVKASLGGWLPRLDVGAGFGYFWSSTDVGVNTATGFITAEGETYSAQAQLRQTLFDGLLTPRSVAAARASERASARLFDEASLSVAFEVTLRFYDLVKAERSLSVLEKTAARSEDLVDRAEALFAAGRAPRSEIFQARVNLGNDRIAVEVQRVRVARARSALAVALGRSPAEALAVAPPPVVDVQAVPSGEPPPLDALVETARTRRPAVAAQAALVEAARARVDVARADYWPSLAATGSYQRQSDELGGSGGVYGDLSRQYSATAQVVLSWNLFDGRRTAAAVDRARAGEVRARADAARTGDAAAAEVADARAAVVALARQIAIARENLAAATQGLALARERLDAGLATQLELRDASLKLTRAELTLVETRIDHAVAVADLNRATGGAL
jgi:outer membrane protein TolC